MAYIQDISLLMRELLKVPKDYTPTAMEISKYIKSRYSSEKDIGKRPMGTRAFSSGPRGPVNKMADASPSTITPFNASPPKVPQRAATKNRVAGRSLNFSTLRSNSAKITKKNDNLLNKLGSDVKAVVKNASQNRTFHQKKPIHGKKLKKPATAPPAAVEVQRSPHGHYRSFWSWQTAKNNIRQAVSEIVTTPAAKTKLSALADQHRLDPNLEIALERQRKEMLKQMLDTGTNRNEPLRTREVIQKLMEDNKLEVQRREIAKLTELARAKVLEARRANFAAKKRDMEYA